MKYQLKKKSEYRKLSDDSERLFTSCWRKYTYYLKGSIDDPKSDSDVLNWLNSIASEKVNNSRSRFYITG